MDRGLRVSPMRVETAACLTPTKSSWTAVRRSEPEPFTRSTWISLPSKSFSVYFPEMLPPFQFTMEGSRPRRWARWRTSSTPVNFAASLLGGSDSGGLLQNPSSNQDTFSDQGALAAVAFPLAELFTLEAEAWQRNADLIEASTKEALGLIRDSGDRLSAGLRALEQRVQKQYRVALSILEVMNSTLEVEGETLGSVNFGPHIVGTLDDLMGNMLEISQTAIRLVEEMEQT